MTSKSCPSSTHRLAHYSVGEAEEVEASALNTNSGQHRCLPQVRSIFSLRGVKRASTKSAPNSTPLGYSLLQRALNRFGRHLKIGYEGEHRAPDEGSSREIYHSLDRDGDASSRPEHWLSMASVPRSDLARSSQCCYLIGGY